MPAPTQTGSLAGESQEQKFEVPLFYNGGEEKGPEEAGEGWDLENLVNPWDKRLEHEGTPQPGPRPLIL